MSATGYHDAVFQSPFTAFETASNSISETINYHVPKIRVNV